MSRTSGASIASRTFRLNKPGELEEVWVDREIKEGQVVVEPEMTSVCHADLRYYTGQRRAEALAKKLPMALLHEGIGKVVESRSEQLHPGQRVVIVPNLPGYIMKGIPKEQCCPACRAGLSENYCHNGGFLGSGTDGMAQSRLVVPSDNVIPVPDSIPDHVAVLAELCSVSYQALELVGDKLASGKAAVFGDGPVGYLTAAMVHHAFGLSEDRLTVFGAIEDKLAHFEFAKREMVQTYDFEHAGGSVDVAIECTGGKFSESAINQAIDLLAPGGHLVLLGVSEERVPINTRDVLEKGLTIHGSSRSTAHDFRQVIKAMESPAYQHTLEKIIPEIFDKVSTADQLAKVMESAAAHRRWEKTIVQFQW